MEILENFSSVLLSNSNVQPSLLELIRKVSSFSISLQEFRKYLTFFSNSLFPVNLLETLCEISHRPNVPSFFADFSKQ
jgi:hypothetical protein